MSEILLFSDIQGPPNPANPNDLVDQQIQLNILYTKFDTLDGVRSLIEKYGREPNAYPNKDKAARTREMLDIAESLSADRIN